jgi:hypothetical protein
VAAYSTLGVRLPIEFLQDSGRPLNARISVELDCGWDSFEQLCDDLHRRGLARSARPDVNSSG